MSASSGSKARTKAEGEHPLRGDPLNVLPDAVFVPRRQRSRVVPTPPRSPLRKPSLPLIPTPPTLIPEEASALLEAHSDADDPLLLDLAQRIERPESPPSGEAYAADIHAFLAGLDDDERETPSDGVIDRSDVTLFLAPTQRGAGAGVYLVRSRRNWSIVSNPTHDDYYLVRRSIADFMWLDDCLRARNEGVIVPSLPSLTFTGRVKHGYAYEHERLRGLQAFLRRVATHAILSTREEVLAFLGALGEEEWQKVRRETISNESSITSALFGSSVDGNAVDKFGRWSEKFLWQTGRRLNKALVWFLEGDSSEEPTENSAEARVERLHTYVKELGTSLAFIRHAAEKLHKQREAERSSTVAMQNALHELGKREGGKFGNQLERVRLEISSENETGSRSMDYTTADRKRSGSGGGLRDEDNSRVHLSPRPLSYSASRVRTMRDSLGAESNIHSQRVTFELGGVSQREEENSIAGRGSMDARNTVVTTMPVARVVDEVFRDYEERARGAQRIMNARREEQDAYEHAVAVYTKLRDKLESRTGSMWDDRIETSNQGLEGLKKEVGKASNRLKEVRERYKKVALSTTDELRRLRSDMHEDLCEALHVMAVELGRQHAAQAEAWKALSQSLNDFRKSSKTSGAPSPPSGSGPSRNRTQTNL